MYIARDTYTGPNTLTRAMPHDVRVTAAEVAASGQHVAWEFSGHVRGRRLYCRTRYVPQPDGSLYVFDSTGRRVMIHPAERVLVLLNA